MESAGTPNESDEKLSAEWLADPDVFGLFYRRNVEGVLRFFMARTLDPHTTADLTAETFAVAFERRDRFDGRRGTSSAWLFGIAKNQLRRMRRRGRIDGRARRRLGIPRIELDDTSIERIEELVDLEKRKQALRRALETLPAGTAAALRLRIMDERPYDEVAKELRCSPAAARVRVSRGLSRLLESMGEEP